MSGRPSTAADHSSKQSARTHTHTPLPLFLLSRSIFTSPFTGSLYSLSVCYYPGFECVSCLTLSFVAWGFCVCNKIFVSISHSQRSLRLQRIKYVTIITLSLDCSNLKILCKGRKKTEIINNKFSFSSTTKKTNLQKTVSPALKEALMHAAGK